jgi:hypothetical protein
MTTPRQVAFIALKEVHKEACAGVALDRVLQKFKLPDCDRRSFYGIYKDSRKRIFNFYQISIVFPQSPCIHQ